MVLVPTAAQAQQIPEAWEYRGFQLGSITFSPCSSYGCFGYFGPFHDLDLGRQFMFIWGWHIWYQPATGAFEYQPVLYVSSSCCFYA